MSSTAPATHLGQHIEFVLPPPRRVEISLARTRSDLIGAFQILYNAYLRCGFISENEKQLRLTPYHLLPTTEVFVAKLRETVTSTITMVEDSPARLPMDKMYSDELQNLRQSGVRLAEIGCLADRRKSPVRFIKVFGELARMLVQVANSREIDALVVATHPRHAGFYSRSFGFQQFGTTKGCPYVKGHPAVAMVLEFSRIRGTELYDCLFGQPFESGQLSRPAWDAETLEYLGNLLDSISVE